ncbi:putative phenol 2-monooxygenase [Fusarium sporotrichioides]|uniref:Putative phenol 2-monooxygenase n=1 Tax=Fusarium sporotrichioides TaxID=5514 RepID=A0A395SCA4_FUSSP|nr:putative phenol 2-monooxygenase [Fusarium sporotrichioides]
MAQNKPEKAYDVVIVGAGPAGLVVAAWMSVAGVKTLLLDRNSAPPASGHADGLDRRSFEVMDKFNLGHTIWQEAHQTIEVSYWIVEWTSLYSVGQRICSSYFIQKRIFLAGDAVHTHSPKAGMGMNTSMQDAFNLGWKLASVIKGCHAPKILETYQEERMPIAQNLLSFDKEMYSAVSEKFGKNRSETLSRTLRKENTSASGSAVRYHANMLINHTDTSRKVPRLLAAGFRLPDVQIMNHSDSCMWRLHEILNGSGHWALLVFGGDISTKSQMRSVRALAAQLSKSCSILQRVNHRHKQQMIGGIEVHLIHSAPRHGIDLHSLPCLFVSKSETLGYDYGKVFVDNVSYTGIGGTVYRDLDIPTWGCIVLVRPDHHIAFCGGLDEMSELESFITRLWTVDG